MVVATSAASRAADQMLRVPRREPRGKIVDLFDELIIPGYHEPILHEYQNDALLDRSYSRQYHSP
jgi:hypothetical protein